MNIQKIISYTIHPVIIPIVGSILFFILLPVYTTRDVELTILGSVFLGTYIVPIFFLMILQKSAVIENFHLENIQERKFPLMFFISITILLSTLIKKANNTMELSLFFYGITLALAIAYLLLYVKFKASLHMMSIGGLIGFFTFFSYEYKINLLLLIGLFFIIAGIVATSRLKLNAHKIKEVYWGLLIGIFSELAVYIFYNM